MQETVMKCPLLSLTFKPLVDAVLVEKMVEGIPQILQITTNRVCSWAS